MRTRWLRRTLQALVTCTALLSLCASAGLPAAEPHWNANQPGSELAMALVTVGPGEIYWERFGHNAILVRDRARGEDALYNYGIFDFEQENFFLNFLRGRMLYRIAAWPAAEDLPNYLNEGRSIDIQELNLSPPQRVALRDFLQWNLRPENAQYRYDYFVDNCSTRVRDALDKALGGAIRQSVAGRSRGFTYRMHALRLTAPDIFVYLGVHAGLGPYADRSLPFWDELFVPMELQKHVRDVMVTDDAGEAIPLLAAEQRLANPRFAPPDEQPPAWRWRFLAAGLLVAGVLVALTRVRHSRSARIAFAALSATIAAFLGLTGLLLAGLWTLTEHRSAWANENLMLFDPLWLLLVPSLVMSARSAWQPRPWQRFLVLGLAALAGLALFLKVFPAFFQNNLDWIVLLLPIELALAASIQPDRQARLA
jgi:hypothetical protein